MLYVAEIVIDNKPEASWGQIYNHTINLPAKIGKIRGVCFFAELGRSINKYNITSAFLPDRRIKKQTASQSGWEIEKKDFYSLQIGCVSLCLNRTNVIISGSPLNAINVCDTVTDTSNLRYDQTYNNNKVEFSESIPVTGGSTLTVIVEEKDIFPAVKRSGYHPLNTNVVTNYKIKVYIDYDR